MPGARGEGYLEMDGETFAVLFTNRALADAERSMGKAITQIVSDARGGGLGMGDVAQLLATGLEYARRESRSRPQSYTINDAWRILDGLGFVQVLEIVVSALNDVLSYRPSREGAASANPPG